jgi:hypothetical protein
VKEMGGAELADGTKLVLVERPGRRTITDNAAATQRLNDLPANLFHRCYAYRPGEIESALAEFEQVPKTSKKGKSGQSLYKDRLADITEQATVEILKVS